ncbi:MAG: hypothetical protein CW338_00805 [Clostridiales bacterium]|nr:hypothetical protein [Clostridiales bacterium]
MRTDKKEQKKTLFTKPKRKIWLIAAAVLLTVICLLVILLPRNSTDRAGILENGDFSRTDTWGIPEGWYTEAWYESADVTEFCTREIDGKPCFCITNFSENDARLAQYVQVEPDSIYCLHGYICAEAEGGRGANFSIEGLYCFSEQVYSTGGEWKEITYWGRTGASQTGLTVFLRLGGYSGEATGSACFRDVTLTKEDSLPDGVFADEWFSWEESQAYEEETEAGGSTALSSIITILFSAILYIVFADILLVWARYDRKDLTASRSPAGYIAAALVLIAAFVIRMIVAVRVTGYDIDVNDFTAWAGDIRGTGTTRFYTTESFCDYPPGYMLVLWLTSIFGNGSLLSIKMPSILCDFALAAAICLAGLKYTSRRRALVMSLIYILCPVTVCTGAAWGQSDAVMALFLGISVILAIRHNWACALPVYTVSVLMKPQALMFGPLGVAALILDIILAFAENRKSDKTADGSTGNAPSVLKKRLISTGAGFAASALVLGIIFLLFTDMTALKQGVGISAPEQDPARTEISYTFECDQVQVFYHNSDEVEEADPSGAAVYCCSDGSVRMMNGDELISSGSWRVSGNTVYITLGEAVFQTTDDFGAEENHYRSRYRLTCSVDTGEASCLYTFSCRGQRADWLICLYGATLSSYNCCSVNGCNLFFLLGENWKDAETTPVSTMMVILCALTFILPFAFCFTRGGYKRTALQLGVLVLVLGGCLVYLLLSASGSGIMSDDWGMLMIILSVGLSLWLLAGGRDLRHLPLAGAVLLLLLFNTATKMHERYLFPALMLLVIAFIVEKDRRIIWLLLGVSAFSLMNVGCVLERNMRIGGVDGHLSAPAFDIGSDTAFLEYMSAAGNFVCAMLGVWIGADLCLTGGSPWELSPYTRGRKQHRLRDSLTGSEGGSGKQEKTGRMTGRDWLIMGVATVLYAVLALTNLGSMKAPQTEYTYRDCAVFDLGESRDFILKFYTDPGRASGKLMISTGEDGQNWELCADRYIDNMDGLGWKAFSGTAFRGRYLKVDFTKCYDANIGEFLCYDAETGEQIPLVLASGFEGHAALCDEQDVLDQAGSGLLARTLAEDNSAFLPVPESYYDPAFDENVLVFDLGSHRNFKALYYSGIQWVENYTFNLVTADSPDGTGQTYLCESADGDCFGWKYVCGGYVLSGRYLRVCLAGCSDMSLFEFLCRDAFTDEVIPLTLVSGPREAAVLCDEPDTLEGEPSWWNSTYFDEIYHARTAYEHLHGLRVYETTHPPLGKVIISWSVGIFGMCPFGWRLPGALCGVFMLPAIYMIARLLLKRRRYAVGAILILALDCMHFTQTRIATIDSYVVLFILWSVYFMFYWMKQNYFGTKYWKTFVPLLASGVFMGLSVASKWTGCYNGIGLAILFFVTWIWRCLQVRKARRMVREDDFDDCGDEQREKIRRTVSSGHLKLFGTLLSCIVFFILIPLVIYYMSYIPYFAYDGGVTVEKVIVAAVGRYFTTGEVGGMLGYHSTPGLGMDHYFYSPWYEWPIDARPMWFYQGVYADGSDVGSTIMTMGNPAVWWGGLLAMLIMIVLIYVYCRRQWSLRGSDAPAALKDSHSMQWLLVVFAVQFLPWTFVPRGTYIYHYFACVPVIILAAMTVLSTFEDMFTARRARIAAPVCAGVPEGAEKRPGSPVFLCILIAYIVLCLVMFIAFFPYASGIEVSTGWLEGMRWFDNWLWY